MKPATQRPALIGKFASALLASAAAIAAATPLPIRSAEDNEAVHKVQGSPAEVELPPGSNQHVSRVVPIRDSTVLRYMIQTNDGLVECSGRVYRIGECAPAGSIKRPAPRQWIVKRHGTWWRCASPSANAKCAGINELLLDETNE